MANKKKTRKTKETVKKVEITYYLPEAEFDYKCSQKVLQWSSKMHDLWQDIRSYLKYGEPTHEQSIELLEKVKSEIYSIAFPLDEE